MDTINLYALKSCSKCNILAKICRESKYVKSSDFKIFIIDTNDENDSNLNLLKEHGVVDMPVLLVNNKFYSFAEAINYIRSKDNENNYNESEVISDVSNKVKIIKLETEHAKKVENALKNETDGYCPCKLTHTEDTKCMCKDFRDSVESLEENESVACDCGLYMASKD